ncbi:MAG: hypothetical protein KDA42_12365, partial [Planctomycetales bacterium]|nr:hypothetical protein [Planctomycetales bacterium]
MNFEHLELRTLLAADYTVNSLADVDDGDINNGTTTLREALNDAALVAGMQTIEFSVTGTINLGSVLPTLSDVTIDGPGSASLTVRRDTGGDYRVFEVPDPVTAEINGLTISNGLTPSGFHGGGVLNDGILSMTDVVVSGNVSSAGGGGVFNTGSLTITNSTITGNQAANAGGGIRNDGGMVDLTNVAITLNSTVQRGGGIYNDFGATLTMVGGSINSNTADNGIVDSGDTDDGGAIMNVASSVTLTGTVISGNTAGDDGGAISSLNTGSFLSFIGVSITGNTAGDDGGAIYNSDLSHIDFIESTIAGNIANDLGGGIANIGAGSLAITRSTLSGNSSDIAGAVNNGSNGVATITNSTLSGNMVTTRGGAIQNVAGANLQILSTTITNNSSTGAVGGIQSANNATISVQNSILAGNIAGTNNPDVNGVFNSLGHNLVGALGAGSGFTATGDLVGSTGSPISPGLGALANNGGPTQTHALLPGSPAIDQGVAAGLSTDQHNLGRTFDDLGIANAAGGDGTDIGAVESFPSFGIFVTPTTGLETTEAGGTDSFDIVLTSAPTADVTIGVTSLNLNEGTVSTSSVVFTSGNWNTPQTVTVTGVDDASPDGSVAYTIALAAATSTDSNYNGIDPDDVSVTNLDNDTVGI